MIAKDPQLPFAGAVYDTPRGPIQCYQVSASDRIDAVQRMTDRAQLEAALSTKPKVFLFDEPLSNLDKQLRVQMREELKNLQRTLGLTTIFVTHDQEEALELADRVVIMEKGTIAQVDTVDRVYEHPASPFVFDFMGSTNIIPAALRGRELYLDGKRSSDWKGLRPASRII